MSAKPSKGRRVAQLVSASYVRQALQEALDARVKADVVEAIVAELETDFEQLVQRIAANHMAEEELRKFHFLSEKAKPLVSLRHLTDEPD